MHQVLLELVVYIQQKYIDKCNAVYILKIDTMISTSAQMMETTKYSMDNDEDPRRRAIYNKNLDAQVVDP